MTKFYKIAVLDFGYSDEFYRDIQNYSQERIVRIQDIDNQDAIHDVDALICSWKDPLDAEVLSQFPDLKYIATRATATKNIDMAYARSHGIKIDNIEGYGDQATAEFVIQQLFSVARGEESETPNMELHGKTVGFLGFGNVPNKIAPVLQALGMHTSYYTPSEEHSQNTRSGVPFADKQSILRSDFVSVHTPNHCESLSSRDLADMSPQTSLIVTTLGLPFNENSFRQWKAQAPNIVIMDQVAAKEYNFSDLHNVYVRDVYAARTLESKQRAEQKLLQNVESFFQAQSPSDERAGRTTVQSILRILTTPFTMVAQGYEEQIKAGHQPVLPPFYYDEGGAFLYSETQDNDTLELSTPQTDNKL